jgi:serine phosphatase RsbU (regulator of sigma subunit)
MSFEPTNTPAPPPLIKDPGSKLSLTAKIYIGFLVAYIFARLVGIESLRSIAFWGAFVLTTYYFFLYLKKFMRKLLWRIRRKLILSYIFIGFIPICLLAALFVLAFWIFMGQATSEMFNSALDSYLLQTKMEGQKLLHLARVLPREEVHRTWFEDLSGPDKQWLHNARLLLYTPEGIEIIQGEEEQQLPEWVKDKDFSGLVFKDSRLWLVSVHHRPDEQKSLLVEAPLTSQVLQQIGDKIGANITYVTGSPDMKDEFEETVGTTRKDSLWPAWWDVPVAWLSLPDSYNWKTGKRITVGDQININGDSEKKELELSTGEPEEPVNDPRLGDKIKEEIHREIQEHKKKKGAQVTVSSDGQDQMAAFALNTNVSRIFDHIFSRSTTLQKFVYVVMLVIVICFLVIELISFIFGFLLARSITASIHNLFEGTERIKKGDFNYKIKIGARDQLGELATSFNGMTESIKNLMIARAEKERLAEALLIARHMQEKLLPKDVTSMGGIDIATMNLPAEEVCGDYYDIIRKNDEELGIIIADVSGKGPSAALYMAEVKGVMLTTSQRTINPKEVLIEANKVLAPTLDSRNFITMTYAMINEPERYMKMCRAGHNPLIHYSARTGTIDIVQSRGIGLGVARNGLFESTLEEVKRSLDSGDILVFYTDGLTEAMNDSKQLYGLERLSQILIRNKDASTGEIKDAIFHDLEQFLGKKLPQDDVTLVLLKIR